MTWDFPLLLVSALSLPLIILFHLLSRRRKTVVVPSLVLWQRLLVSEKRSLSLRRFLADALLALQLIAAALVVLGLTGPRINGSTGRITKPTAVLVDISAGMRAETSSGSRRFEEAQDKARDIIKRKSRNTEMLLLSAGSRVQIEQGFTTSKRELLDALNRLVPQDLAGNPSVHLRTAEALAAGRSEARVIFVTDGAFEMTEPIRESTTVIRVGESLNNTGITGFAVRRYPDGGREALLTIDHFSTLPREIVLELRVDERLLSSETLTLKPMERLGRTVSWSEVLSGKLSARLRGSRDDGDSLGSDDRVSAFLDPEPPIRVAMISPGNWFLETLLRTHPNVSLDVFSSLNSWKPGADWDLVVADRLYPPEDLSSPLLAIYPFQASPQPPLPLLPGDFLQNVVPERWESGHRITRDLDLSRVSVSRAMSLETGPGVDILAEGSGIPLIMTGYRDDYPWVALSFDVLRSSLPLRPAFPILMHGALSWLVPGNVDSGVAMTKSGYAELPLSSGIIPTRVVNPDGLTVEPGDRSYPLNTVGFWTTQRDEEEIRTFGVNLLSEDESNLMIRWDLEDAVRPEFREREPTGRFPAPVFSTNPRALAGLLLFLSVLLLFIEWVLQIRHWSRG